MTTMYTNYNNSTNDYFRNFINMKYSIKLKMLKSGMFNIDNFTNISAIIPKSFKVNSINSINSDIIINISSIDNNVKSHNIFFNDAINIVENYINKNMDKFFNLLDDTEKSWFPYVRNHLFSIEFFMNSFNIRI